MCKLCARFVWCVNLTITIHKTKSMSLTNQQLPLLKELNKFSSWISQHMAVRHSSLYSIKILIHEIFRHLILFHFAMLKFLARLRTFHLILHVIHIFHQHWNSSADLLRRVQIKRVSSTSFDIISFCKEFSRIEAKTNWSPKIDISPSKSLDKKIYKTFQISVTLLDRYNNR